MSYFASNKWTREKRHIRYLGIKLLAALLVMLNAALYVAVIVQSHSQGKGVGVFVVFLILQLLLLGVELIASRQGRNRKSSSGDAMGYAMG